MKAMVDHDHDRVKTVNGGKVGDEVHKEILERVRLLESKGSNGRNHRMGEHLVCLTDCTSRHIFPNICGEA